MDHKSNDRGPRKRKAEGDLRQKVRPRRGGGNVTTEAEIGAMKPHTHTQVLTATKSWEKQRMGSSLETPERVHLC